MSSSLRMLVVAKSDSDSFPAVVVVAAAAAAHGNSSGSTTSTYGPEDFPGANTARLVLSSMSIVSCLLMLLSCGLFSSLWRHHSVHVVFIALFQLGYHLVAVAELTHQITCKDTAGLLQFFLLGEDLYFFVLAFHLYYTTKYPFDSSKWLGWMYHVLVWSLSALTAVGFSVQSKDQSTRDDAVAAATACWYALNVPQLAELWIVLYLVPILIGYFISMACFITVVKRVRRDACDFQNRPDRSIYLDNMRKLILASFCYWCLIVGPFLVREVVDLQSYARFQQVLAFVGHAALAFRGTYSFVLWVVFSDLINVFLMWRQRNWDAFMKYHELNWVLRRQVVYYATKGIQQAASFTGSPERDAYESVYSETEDGQPLAVTFAPCLGDPLHYHQHQYQHQTGQSRRVNYSDSTSAGAAGPTTTTTTTTSINGDAETECKRRRNTMYHLRDDNRIHVRCFQLRGTASILYSSEHESHAHSRSSGDELPVAPPLDGEESTRPAQGRRRQRQRQRQRSYHRRHGDRSAMFRDFEPEKFRQIRELCGISNEAYIDSFRGRTRERFSEGKSGAFLYYTGDQRFILKTCTLAEQKFLLTILPKYMNHLKQNPNSLICRYVGCHKLIIREQCVRFIVLTNIFNNSSVGVDAFYDLKGSYVGRFEEAPRSGTQRVCKFCGKDFFVGLTKEECRQNPLPGNGHEYQIIGKDLNWAFRKLGLPTETATQMVQQLGQDSRFLASINSMDYSLVIGLRTCQHVCCLLGSSSTEGGLPAQRRRTSTSGSTITTTGAVGTRASNASTTGATPPGVTGNSFSPMPYHHHHHHHAHHHHHCASQCQALDLAGNAHVLLADAPYDLVRTPAVLAQHPDHSQRNSSAGIFPSDSCVVYMGIIDILTSWSCRKQLEHWLRVHVQCRDRQGISCVHPEAYAKRFRRNVVDVVIQSTTSRKRASEGHLHATNASEDQAEPEEYVMVDFTGSSLNAWGA